MTISLHTEDRRAVLDRMFAAAEHDDQRSARLHSLTDAAAGPTNALERAEERAEIYMPVSARGGELLYSLVRATRPETVVEFGTSFGISTVYLAAAVADNGTGHVFSTELSEHKVVAARENLREAGLAEWVSILRGDARETLGELNGPIGLVLLDGWKDLCLPVLRSLEDRLAEGALVIADDTTFPSMAEYLGYVRDPASGYVSTDFPVEDGMEISCWTGR